MKISKENQSLIAIAAGFSIIALVSKNFYFFIPAGLAVISSPFPYLKKIVHLLWQKLGEVIGWIMQHIILTVLFYLILTPIALIKKVLGNDVLQIKNKERKTTFHSRNKLYKPADMENVW